MILLKSVLLELIEPAPLELIEPALLELMCFGSQKYLATGFFLQGSTSTGSLTQSILVSDAILLRRRRMQYAISTTEHKKYAMHWC